MSLQPSISVIISAYNIQNYIERCLKSILCQTEVSYEVIVVNDGSTDDTGKIISKIAEKNDRIAILTQENTGLSKARQNGLNLAHGEYVLFVDGDDYLMPDSLRDLAVFADENKSDIVCFNYKRVFEDGRYLEFPSYNLYGETGPFIKRILLYDILPNVCFKLIRKKFILENSVVFPPAINFGEDLALTVSMAVHDPVVGFLNRFIYCYYIRPESLTQSPEESVHDLSSAVQFAEKMLLSAGLAEKYHNEFLFYYFMHNYFLRLNFLAEGNVAVAKKLFSIIKHKRKIMAQNKHVVNHLINSTKRDRLLFRAFNFNFTAGRIAGKALKLWSAARQIKKKS